MKVVCIDKNDYEYFTIINYYIDITINKKYDIISYFNDKCLILNDNQNERLYPIYLFKTISEYRNDKINKLLEDENNMYRKL